MHDKQFYGGPEIVDFGTVVALTTGNDTPYRENPAGDITYENSTSARFRLGGPDLEADLGGR